MREPKYPSQAELDRARGVGSIEAERLIMHFYQQCELYNRYLADESVHRRRRENRTQLRLDVATASGCVTTILSLGVLCFAIYHKADLYTLGAAIAAITGSGATFAAGVRQVRRGIGALKESASADSVPA